jgi:hypothetical protein
MNTKKMIGLAAFISGLLMSAPAYASMAIHYDFSSDQHQALDNPANSVTVSAVNSIHTLSHNLLSFDHQAQGATKLAHGKLNINNIVVEDSAVTSVWPLKSGIFSSAVNFAIFESNKSATNITFLLNNASLVSFDISKNTAPKAISFALMPTQLTSVSRDRTLTLKIKVASEWDLRMNSFKVSANEQMTIVTEPALIGLIGVSLIGLSLLRGNKKD